MGVDRSDYIIIGYKMPFDVKFKNGELLKDAIWDEKYLRYMEGWVGEQYRIIFDGMSGNYIVFGKEKAMANEYEGFDFIELNLDPVELIDAKLKAQHLFNDIDFDFDNPKALIFSHYS